MPSVTFIYGYRTTGRHAVVMLWNISTTAAAAAMVQALSRPTIPPHAQYVLGHTAIPYVYAYGFLHRKSQMVFLLLSHPPFLVMKRRLGSNSVAREIGRSVRPQVPSGLSARQL